MSNFFAGAGVTDISPTDSQFLFGYPHVERYSTGVHDPLLSSSLYLNDGETAVIFIANDIIFFNKASVRRIRTRISDTTNIAPQNIMISATHTHSGPISADYISNTADPVVPKTDPAYLQFLEDQVVKSAVNAHEGARPAALGYAQADSTGIGTNRRDPAGPNDHAVPVLMVRAAEDKALIACMIVCCMHPTVLHEDSTLVSADFPGMTRQYLQEAVLGKNCPLIYHTGPSGNQSPRHVTRANTFDEATRLGVILGKAVAEVIPQISYSSDIDLSSHNSFLDLPRKTFPSVEQAETELAHAVRKLESLRSSMTPHQEVRTAECDWFGAEETLTLAKAAGDGRLAEAYDSCLPAEIQIIRVGNLSFIGWPAEIFVEFGLAVKAANKNSFIISLANGELQGYIVTEQAAAEGGYEASNGLFGPECGRMLVEKTQQMLDQM